MVNTRTMNSMPPIGVEVCSVNHLSSASTLSPSARSTALDVEAWHGEDRPRAGPCL